MTALFIGVVSHPATRFTMSIGPDGLAQRLASALRELGVETIVEVNAVNAYERSMLAIDGRAVARSLNAQLQVESQWRAFLRNSAEPLQRLRAVAAHRVRRVRELVKFIRPWHDAERDSPGARRIRRLINIELSHFALLRDAAASACDWTLIIEDDASSVDVHDCALGLAGLMSKGPRQPAYVNVSQSFAPADLHISHLLSPASGTWEGQAARAVLASSKPVTNTVCAILYRTSFVAQLLGVTDAMPLDPVIPIDWKLNLALMQLFHEGRLEAGDCWTVTPAPIDQLSMQAQR